MPKLKTESTETKTAGDLRSSNTMMALLGYVERFERLQEERDALGDDQKELMEEAKGVGYDTKTMRTAIRRRKMDPATRLEADGLLDTYEHALAEAQKLQTQKSQDDGQ